MNTPKGGRQSELFWLRHSTLSRLQSFGWSCYLMTAAGLVPASGTCWRPAFALVPWVNLLCTHDARAEALFRTHPELAADAARLVAKHHHAGRSGVRDLNAQTRQRILEHWRAQNSFVSGNASGKGA